MLLKRFLRIYKQLLVIIFVMSSCFLQAQIVNVENLRKEKDTVGWSGYARLDLELEKNANSIFVIENQLKLQYKTKKSLWFLIHDMDFKEVNSVKIVNKSTQHLRFSYELSPKTSFESFIQSQSDRVSQIKLRALVGAGLRFKLYTGKQAKFFLGTTLMYEYEKSIEEEVNSIHNDIRKSIYVSFKLHPTNNISIVNTTYYQPLINKFSDYRILSETSLVFNVLKNLKFLTTFSYQYDAFPVLTVVKEQYKLKNGLVYFF